MKNRATPNRKLEAARLKKRWSIVVASKKVGVSVNTFNRWERGLQLPQLETLDQLCKAFDMSPEELGFENVIVAKRRTKATIQNQVSTEKSVIDEQLPTNVAIQETPVSLPQSQHFRNELATYVKQVKKSLEEISQAQKSDITEQSEGLLRKQAVTLLVSAPAAVFGLAQDTRELLLYSDEVLSLSAVSLPLCWQLYYEGGFSELNRILPGYITQLSALAQQPSRHQKWAANLASQAHQLSYLLALQRQDFGTSLKHIQDATHYGQVAVDINLQAASLARKAYVYFCLHHDIQRLQAYQEALRFCNACSPLLKGYIYTGLAETHASRKDDTMAHEFLKLARESYPDRPEDDPVYSYTHFRWPTFYNFAGQVYLHLNQPRQAWGAFANVDKLVPVSEEPYRVELVVNQAATALALGEQEQSCALLETAVKSARALGSALRYDEAYMIYERMQEKWGQEPRVKALENLFY